jgi:hypothetical protein
VNIRVAIKSKSANIGILNLKNIVVQDRLNNSCIKKKVNAEQNGWHFSSFHMITNAKVMKVYNIGQTIPKI